MADVKYTKVLIVRMVLLMAYLFGGSAIFLLIEKGENNDDTSAVLMQTLKKNITHLYNLTEQDFDDLVDKVEKITRRKPQKAWSYDDCHVYGLHLLTTIGYGTITPVTQLGQVVTIIYGLFGIPLTILTLRAMAWHLNELLGKLISFIEIKCLKRTQVKYKEMKIVFFNVFFTLFYLFLSALMSAAVDGYNYITSVYVWFITMTTVGFGDFVPIESNVPHLILIGLCLMSGTIDSIVMYYECSSDISLLTKFKNCLCCRGQVISVGTKINIKQTMELSGKNHASTQTEEIR